MSTFKKFSIIISASEQDQDDSLPDNVRCVLHSFFLLIEEDAKLALEDEDFQKLSDSALKRATEFLESKRWADIKNNYRLQFQNDCTFEPETFDSIICLLAYTESQQHKANPVFQETHIQFFREYVDIMSCVRKTRQLFQDVKFAYLGCLLPILANCLSKLEFVKQDLVCCNPLLDAIVNGIRQRFETQLENMNYKVAAGFHPTFRLKWTSKYSLDPTWTKDIEVEMCKLLRETMEKSKEENFACQSPTNEFLAEITTSTERETTLISSEAETLIRHWLAGESTPVKDNCFLGSTHLSSLFRKYNTAFPSGAPIMKKIKHADVMKLKANSLATTDFENMLFIQMNKDLLSL